MTYIKGGEIQGASRSYPGCRDKTSPSRKIALASHAHQLYFARKSTVWGEEPYNKEGSGIFGGLGVTGFKAFDDSMVFDRLREIDVKNESLRDIISNQEMIVAGYVITLQQFSDVMCQENKYDVGDIEIPEELALLLTLEHPTIDLKNRVGKNAIKLPSGNIFEIDVDDDYSALCYLGDIEIDGEVLRTLCFTSPHSYELALAEEDEEHRLNPASKKYIEMIASGIVELGEGNGDWTIENAYEYLLSLSPFTLAKFAEQTELIKQALAS